MGTHVSFNNQETGFKFVLHNKDAPVAYKTHKKSAGFSGLHTFKIITRLSLLVKLQLMIILLLASEIS